MTSIRKNIALSLVIVLSYQYPMFSQEHIKTKVTIQHGKISLVKLIDLLRKQTGYAFAYDCKLIDTNKMIFCDFPPNSDIETILNQSLPSSISYKNRGNHIILFATKPTSKNSPIGRQSENLQKPTSNTIPKDSTLFAKLDTLSQPTVEPFNNLEKISDDQTIKIDTNSIKKQVQPATRIDLPIQHDSVSQQAIEQTQINTPTKQTSNDSLAIKNSPIILDIELAGYNKLGCTTMHIGYKHYYCLASYSSDLKVASWMGLGIGIQTPIWSKLDFATEVSYNKLCGGESFKNGLSASTIQIKPIISYQLFSFLKLLVGPEGYLLSKKLTDPSSNTVTRANPSFGYGVYFGTRIDLNELFSRN
jgi:hypothetical protein